MEVLWGEVVVLLADVQSVSVGFLCAALVVSSAGELTLVEHYRRR